MYINSFPFVKWLKYCQHGVKHKPSSTDHMAINIIRIRSNAPYVNFFFWFIITGAYQKSNFNTMTVYNEYRKIEKMLLCMKFMIV